MSLTPEVPLDHGLGQVAQRGEDRHDQAIPTASGAPRGSMAGRKATDSANADERGADQPLPRLLGADGGASGAAPPERADRNAATSYAKVKPSRASISARPEVRWDRIRKTKLGEERDVEQPRASWRPRCAARPPGPSGLPPCTTGKSGPATGPGRTASPPRP